MLVDVVRLRHRGVKRPPEEVRAERPQRGRLTYGPWRTSAPGPGAASGWTATLTGEDWPNPLIPSLEQARITRIRDGALVIVGVEDVGRLAHPEHYPQAWWCRVVSEG